MAQAIIGRKIGMTRFFLEGGKNIPVTVIQAGPCIVTQIKTIATDGYAAVQLGFEDVKPRNSTMAVIGHDIKAGTAPKRIHKELRCKDDAEAGVFTVGATVDASILAGVGYVDVVGISKGKGFQGVMKKFGFKGLTATHGTERKHRSPGSIGSHGTDRGHGAKIKKGKRMAGQMGDDQVTARSLDVVKIDAENNVILVKGAVPGATNGILVIRAATRLYKRKAKKLVKA
ncbi:MAG: 50S ribosomal protein L3 [Planctomycetota bacterium]|nr:MAG: 50S ribosomal protein L3 [Planctomycetota bacterium]RLS96633.1 MAG: 50S ribosomal protein L3 [Planctomycetota bacterium]